MSIRQRLAKLGAKIVGREPPAWAREMSDAEIAAALADAARRLRLGALRLDARTLGAPRPGFVDLTDEEVRAKLNAARVAEVAQRIAP